MGFFGDLKEDLSQAVNELLPDEKTSETNDKKPQSVEVNGFSDKYDLEKILAELPENSDGEFSLEGGEYTDSDALGSSEFAADGMDYSAETSGGEYSNPDNAEYADSPDANMDYAEAAIDEAFADLNSIADSAAAKAQEPLQDDYIEKTDNYIPEYTKGAERRMDAERNISDETSIITTGMKVNGDIETEGSLELLGTVKGNITVAGKLNITGYITGNSKANEVYAENAKITGDITSESSVKIGAGSVIVGNITAFSAAIAGAVKGDIDVHGPVILDSSAIVMGNIKSKSVQINNGAAIEGMCSQCYADVSPTAFFDDYKTDAPKGKKN